MFSTDKIRVRLAEYVLNEISLGEFEDWFVSHSWNVRQSGDQELQKLVFEIESKLAEYSGGHINEDSLRRNLAPMAKQYSVEVTIGETLTPIVRIRTGSSTTIAVQADLQIGFVDIQPSVACV